jgi:hypothetical protein
MAMIILIKVHRYVKQGGWEATIRFDGTPPSKYRIYSPNLIHLSMEASYGYPLIAVSLKENLLALGRFR